MNEMEFSLQQTKLEQDAKVKVAEIEAKAKVEAAKQQRKTGRFDRFNVNNFLAGLAVFAVVGGFTGGMIFQHVNHTNKYAEQVERCEVAGGTWTPRVQRVDYGRGDYDEWYEICVKK